MPTSNHHVRERQRLDFAKIQGSIQIPNLIEVQMKSYQVGNLNRSEEHSLNSSHT